MAIRLILLEDDARRVAAMRAVLAALSPSVDAVIFDCAQELINSVGGSLHDVHLMSLDHDLELQVAASGLMRDLGTGREVADFLASRPAMFPVVIHSSNAPAADGMERVLTEAGWNIRRVAPYDDLTWINEAWAPVIRKLLRSVA